MEFDFKATSPQVLKLSIGEKVFEVKRPTLRAQMLFEEQTKSEKEAGNILASMLRFMSSLLVDSAKSDEFKESLLDLELAQMQQLVEFLSGAKKNA